MKILFIFFLFFGQVVVVHANKSKVETIDQVPTSIHINYSVKTSIGHGELIEAVDFVKDDNSHTFNITSNAQATGIFKVINPGNIMRESRGIITHDGLKPEFFSDRRSNKEPRISQFDWKNKKLIINNEGEVSLHPLPEFTLDRISLSYNFIFSPPAGDFVEVHVTDGRELQPMRFKVSQKKLDTPIGELDTIVLTKLLTEADKFEREIWLAPRYHMIPVRIRTVENDGMEIEKTVTEIRLDFAEHESLIVPCCLQQ